MQGLQDVTLHQQVALLFAQDYVKWRGHLFHWFLRALVDDSVRVRSLAGYLLADTLSTKVQHV